VRQPDTNLEIIWSDWVDAIRRGDLQRLAGRVTPSTTHSGIRPDLICANGDEVIENARWTSENLPTVEAIELIGSGDHVVLCVRAPGIGLPAEAFGFSNNPRVFLGMPNWSSVRLRVRKTDLRTRITLRYP